MCGIAGVLNFKGHSPLNHLIKLSDGMKHRGPDDEGFYVIHKVGNKGVDYIGNSSNPNITDFKHFNTAQSQSFTQGILHRRFSILDTSIKGHQPIKTEDGKLILSFNGEIFNYVEIREELLEKGYEFISTSDTEVVLKAYQEWGVDCFNMFNGFWAIAILDLRKNICVLSRDRFGQKPLYYYEKDQTFYFSSEINNLRSICPEINTVNKESAYLYLYHDRRDSFTSSMYEDLQSVDRSNYMIVDLTTGQHKSKIYWDYPQVDSSNSKKTADELAEELSSIIEEAVKVRLRSDVPFAANLSGGLDSATVVYHASEILKKENKKITTHTFEYKNNKTLSEKDDAGLIARTCNTDHDVLYFDSDDIWEDLEKLVKFLEEPIHSPAAYIQWLAWRKIADMGFKVILHGAANDELMMGYSYFLEIQDKYDIRRFNFPLRMQGNNIFYYKNILRLIKWTLKKELIFRPKNNPLNKHPKNRVFKEEFLNDHISSYNKITHLLRSSDNGVKRRYADFRSLRIPFWNNYMDKSMMNIPIEVRQPFLDKNVVEFCFKNSEKVFYHKGWSKYLLRKSLKEYLPKRITWNNRKKGFSSPTRDWLIKNKKSNLDILKSNTDLNDFINVSYIEENYDSLNHNLLWRIVNFAIWLDVCKVKI